MNERMNWYHQQILQTEAILKCRYINSSRTFGQETIGQGTIGQGAIGQWEMGIGLADIVRQEDG